MSIADVAGEATDLAGRAHQGPLCVEDLPPERGYELIDGSLYVTPLGDLEHQSLIMDYAMRLTGLAPEGLRVLAGVNVVQGRMTLVEPDVAVVDPRGVDPGGLGVAPADLRLVIEITSPSTRRRDLSFKRELYREWKVPYLIIDRSTTPFTAHMEGEPPVWVRRFMVKMGLESHENVKFLTEGIERPESGQGVVRDIIE